MKSASFAILLLIWGVICAKYYLKISAMLNAGGSGDKKKGPNPAATIKKFFIAVFFCMVIGVLYKGLAIFMYMGYPDLHIPPPCYTSYVDIVSVILLLCTSAILIAQNPQKKATAKVASAIDTDSSK